MAEDTGGPDQAGGMGVDAVKFICDKCIKEAIRDGEEPVSREPCILVIKNVKRIELMRPNFISSLRRCPSENDTNENFTGIVPIANWRKA